ncbi:MAG: hypothetical protein HYR60_30605 [Acidobacteria bacterium]|nr:hypothetical protein [Acidobacteriota bacterium]
MKRLIACVVYLLSLSPIFGADSLMVGTWVRRDTKERVHVTLKVEAAGAGLKLTYTVTAAQAPAGQIMTVLTQLDGKDAVAMVDGKPSGQTMAIRSIDSRHMSGIVKMAGDQIGASKSEISLDGKVCKVENTSKGPDGKPTTSVEYWDRK